MTGRHSPSLLVAAVTGAFLMPAPAGAVQQQAPPDSVVPLDRVVVTADRVSSPLASSIAGVSVLTAPQVARTASVTVADALRRVPGFALVDFDGLGFDPQLVVRGFYGGGEAEYVVVMVDGRPINDVQGGLVAWDAIPLSAVERVEVVRGGTSALWGDAALGGVINVITRDPAVRGGRWTVAGGSHGSLRVAADTRASLFGRAASLFAGVDRTDGFRAHAQRTTGRLGGTIALAGGASGALHLSALTHWRDFDVPGPLPGELLAADRSARDPFYRRDHTDDRGYRLALDGERVLDGRVRLSGSLAGELRNTAAVRTIPLAPEFADTKLRDLGTRRGFGGVQLSLDDTGLPLRDQLVVGIDASYATIDSDYHALEADGAGSRRGELDSSGSGHRRAAAAYAQYTIRPTDRVRFSAGVRADWLRDEFDVHPPEEPAALTAAHSAVSPRVGVNVRYLDAARSSGHVYLSAGRSFKAPTLDQLFDRRRLAVPFPPFAVTTSNELLAPQRGENIEAGIYHAIVLVPARVDARLSLSVYRMDMEDELDFDLQTLRYVNIGRSRHDGVEAGLDLRGPRSTTAYLNYTWQGATSRSGDDAGRQLKAIPGHFVTAGANTALIGRLEGGIDVRHARGTFLDDANTRELPSYTRIDARAAYPLRGVQLFVEMRNLFDAEYSTTAFPDPSGADVVYYHPAAGRTVQVGVRGNF